MSTRQISLVQTKVVWAWTGMVPARPMANRSPTQTLAPINTWSHPEDISPLDRAQRGTMVSDPFTAVSSARHY